jgi:hypothetical protein
VIYDFPADFRAESVISVFCMLVELSLFNMVEKSTSAAQIVIIERKTKLRGLLAVSVRKRLTLGMALFSLMARTAAEAFSSLCSRE